MTQDQTSAREGKEIGASAHTTSGMHRLKNEQSYMSACRIVRQSRTWTCPFPESGGIWEVIQLTLKERISERIVEKIVVVSVPQIQEQIVEIVKKLSGADSAAHWGQIVEFPLQQTMETNSLRIGGWWWAPQSTPSRLKNFLRRARVRDDSGRSPQIELEPERSFNGPLSGQSVHEQTSGVLWRTESVRDDKVQEQDWRQALEQKSRGAPPARPRGDITRCQAAKVSG